MAGWVFGYFAYCIVVMPLFFRIALLLLYVGVRYAEVQVTNMGFVTGLALAEKPTFHNVNS